MNDELILIDLDDNQIGTGEKEDVHMKGQLHRAFSVFLYDGDRMLVQRRNKNKYHSGGLWANACCSHPRNGEELKDAVPRRMMEELGVEAEVEEIFSFIYRTEFSWDLYEYECDHVFLGEYSGAVSFSKDELSEIRWIEIDELKRKLVDTPEKFASWFIIAAPEVIAEIENRK